ncbi:hypothetical protein B0H65DRAFT_97798 [Neurospora tetraspora]|uniref:Uncharacterized protein n=1 Tax=Neurospora tetraspora TaxID=94610 RepID=A0AAE0MUA0_9PEZI|nr:hypothetical protein B0H65DRAFT_97798 [Neurospora tetraspora]
MPSLLCWAWRKWNGALDGEGNGKTVPETGAAFSAESSKPLSKTAPIDNLPLTGLSMGERTGSRVFQRVWSYVIFQWVSYAYKIRRSDDKASSLLMS